MKRIGGNATAAIETMMVTTNDIGEPVKTWTQVCQLTGYLDLMGETKENNNLSSFVSDSTHVFICDYVALSGVTPETARLKCGNEAFQIIYVDDPMGLHHQLEIYLKKSGWQNGQ